MNSSESALLRATGAAFSRARAKALVLKATDKRVAALRPRLSELYSKRDLPDEIACTLHQDQLTLAVFSEGSIPQRLPDAFLSYEWAQCFKPLKTASFFWHGRDPTVTARAYLFPEEPFLGFLENTPTLVVIATPVDVLFAFQIDLQESVRVGRSEDEARRQHIYLDDPLAAKLYGHIHARGTRSSPREKLLKSYIDRFESEAREAMLCIEENLDQQNILLEKVAAQKTFLGKFYESPRYYRGIYQFFKERLKKENPAIIEWISKIHSQFKNIGLGCLNYQARHLFTCALYSPEVTKSGLQFPSHDLENNFELVALDPDAMGQKAEQFWSRLPWDFLSFYREVIGATNCPVNPQNFFAEAPLFEGNLEEAQKLVDNLLTEAVELKQATIPPGAYHPIDQGSNIKTVRMFELGSEVAAVFADSCGDYLLVTCNPRDRAIRVAHPDSGFLYQAERAKALQHGELHGSQPDAAQVELIQARVSHTLDRFDMGIKVFLATLIRDFWVVEERETIFGSARLAKKVPKLHSDRGRQVLVYLPRVRYLRDFRPGDQSELNYKVRAPHWVRDHIRKAANPSD